MLIKQYREVHPTVSETLAQASRDDELIDIESLVIKHHMPILRPLIRDEMSRRSIIPNEPSERDPGIENILTDINFSLDALKDLFHFGLLHNMPFLTIASANELINRHERDYIEKNLYFTVGKDHKPDLREINELLLVNLFPDGVTDAKDIDFIVRQLVIHRVFYSAHPKLGEVE